MTVRSRNFRIEDHIWEPFAQKAKKMGIPATTFLKLLVIKTNEEPQKLPIIIESMEVLEMPEKVEEDVNRLAHIAKKAIAKRKSLSSK